MKKSLLNLVSIAFVGTLLGRGLRYSFNIVIARGLGPDALGLFAFGMVVMKAFSTLSRFGLDTTTTKFIPIYREQGNDSKLCGITIFSLAFSVVIGILLSFVIYVVIKLSGFTSDFAPVTVSFLIGIPLFSLMMVGSSATTGFKETQYSVYIRDIIQSSSGIFLIFIASFYTSSIIYVIYGYLASLLIGGVSAIFFLFRLGAFNSRPKLEVKKYLSFSIPVVVVAISQYIVTWTDIFMLGIFVSPTEVGWYQAAYQTSVLLILVLGSVNSIFPTIASELYNNDELEELEVIYTVVTKWVAYLTSLGFIFLCIYRSEILSLFNIEAHAAQTALIILAFGQTITAITGPVGYLLTMSGNERLESLNTVVLAIINIVLNLVLIQYIGIVGAATATAISLLTLNIIRLLEIKILIDIQPYGVKYWKGVVGLMVSFMYMLVMTPISQDNLFFTIITGSVALLLFIFTMKLSGFDDQDKKLVKVIK